MGLQRHQFALFDAGPYTNHGPRLEDVQPEPDDGGLADRIAKRDANRAMKNYGQPGSTKSRYAFSQSLGGPMLDAKTVFGVPKRPAFTDQMTPFNPGIWRQVGRPAEVPIHSVATQQSFTSQNRLMQLHLNPVTGKNPRLLDEHPLVERTMRAPKMRGNQPRQEVNVIVQGNHRAMARIGKGEIERRRAAWQGDEYRPQQLEMFMPAQVYDRMAPGAEGRARAANEEREAQKERASAKKNARNARLAAAGKPPAVKPAWMTKGK